MFLLFGSKQDLKIKRMAVWSRNWSWRPPWAGERDGAGTATLGWAACRRVGIGAAGGPGPPEEGRPGLHLCLPFLLALPLLPALPSVTSFLLSALSLPQPPGRVPALLSPLSWDPLPPAQSAQLPATPSPSQPPRLGSSRSCPPSPQPPSTGRHVHFNGLPLA